MSLLKVNINPKLLEWARKESGFQESQIAEALSIKAEKYIHWETHGKDIPFGKLKDISTKFKRQIATFFLEEIPPKNKKPKDYRNLNLADATLSPETLLAMRRAHKFQSMAFELEGAEFWEKKFLWLNDIKKFKTDEEIANWLRGKLKISIEDQFHFKTNSEAYKKWRNAIEDNLGILTFQFAMPLKEVQGFCYSDQLPYSVVVSGKNGEAARIFTLFHELAHILKHQSGICLPDHVSSSEQIEYSCNRLAGKFLLPTNAIIFTEDVDEILKYSRRFKVSSEVYLRRMYEEELISQNSFFTLLETVKSRVKPPKKGFAKSTPLQRSINQRGVAFYNSVMEGVNKNKLSYSKASDALGLSVKYLIKD